MNCRSERSTTASQSDPIPELLQMKMKRTPAARSCSARSSPPVPLTEIVEVGFVETVDDELALTIGCSAASAERAATMLKPAAVDLRMKLRREDFPPR